FTFVMAILRCNFFMNAAADPLIYMLSLHDALPIYCSFISIGVLSSVKGKIQHGIGTSERLFLFSRIAKKEGKQNGFIRCADKPRSEEHTSELQSRENLVCRLLLAKKKTSLTCSSR